MRPNPLETERCAGRRRDYAWCTIKPPEMSGRFLSHPISDFEFFCGVSKPREHPEGIQGQIRRYEGRKRNAGAALCSPIIKPLSFEPIRELIWIWCDRRFRGWWWRNDCDGSSNDRNCPCNCDDPKERHKGRHKRDDFDRGTHDGQYTSAPTSSRDYLRGLGGSRSPAFARSMRLAVNV